MTITSEKNFPTSFNRELILDLTLQAFSMYDLNHSDEDGDAPIIHDYIPIASSIREDTIFNVFDDSGVLVTDGGEVVTTTGKITINRSADSRREKFKYLVSRGTNFSVAEYNSYAFEDWASYSNGPFDFASYLITGYNLSGDFMRKKQTTYLNVLCDRTETVYTIVEGDVVLARQSSCLVQAQWDWNNSDSQGKWSRQFEAYRLFLPKATSPSSGDAFDYGARVIETKNKLRGSGKGLSVYFQSSPGKDMKLLGWGVLGYKGDNP